MAYNDELFSEALDLAARVLLASMRMPLPLLMDPATGPDRIATLECVIREIGTALVYIETARSLLRSEEVQP